MPAERKEQDFQEDPALFTVTGLEIKSFIAWVLTTIIAIGFTLWAFLPINHHNEHGPYYLPNRYYILGISNWLIFTIYMWCAALYSLGMIKSPPRDSYLTMVDKYTILIGFKSVKRINKCFLKDKVD